MSNDTKKLNDSGNLPFAEVACWALPALAGAWWASAITSMIWEFVTNSHHPMLPVCYGVGWFVITYLGKKYVPNAKLTDGGCVK